MIKSIEDVLLEVSEILVNKGIEQEERLETERFIIHCYNSVLDELEQIKPPYKVVKMIAKRILKKKYDIDIY